jgi:hypothetical protein
MGNSMDHEPVSEWLNSLSLQRRVGALALVYSRLTVSTRELFFPERTKGREEIVLNMLHGVNELHHTLANYLVDHTGNEGEAFPVDTLSRQLLEIASQYRIQGLLSWAIESARKSVGLE